MAAYYNEIDPYAAEWLRNLIKAGHIADGEVDTRSIVDVQPDELREFTQCHFFAGIAGWSYALKLAGWQDNRKIWTGSCPCQPFSTAGKGKGTDDPRHLWPHLFRLIRGCRPPVVMGEQVAGAAGYGWLNGVGSDLESENYSIKGVDIPACSVNAPHIRQRLYWVANANSGRCRETGERRTLDEIQGRELYTGMSVEERSSSDLANTESWRRRVWQSKDKREASGEIDTLANYSASNDGPAYDKGHWSNSIWINGADGKKRRSQSGICLLADGVPNRMGKLRAYGNAIVPPLAAEVIRSFMETEIG